jgi:hypothetical protein
VTKFRSDGEIGDYGVAEQKPYMERRKWWLAHLSPLPTK